MKVTEINPYTVIERFPEHKETIKHLYKNNPNFQILCSDYRKCVKALKIWTESDLREAPQRRKEYENLLQELESEILKNLNICDPPHAE